MTIEISDFKGLPPGSPANFPQMPTVGGDPVIESGSNSDGEWTRWADGTQICKNSSLSISHASNSELLGLWNLPASFIDTEYVTTVTQRRDGASPPPSNYRQGVAHENTVDRTAAIANIGFLSSGAYSDNGAFQSMVSATGRWK